MYPLVIGCDNAAYFLKIELIQYLKSHGIMVEDLGCTSSDDKTNYPTIAARVCQAIIDSQCQKRGILLCGTGIGMSITANKFKNIRAAVCHDSYSSERAVLSNNCNVICMGARVIGPELAKKLLSEWLGLEYQDGRSTPKIREIQQIESANFK